MKKLTAEKIISLVKNKEYKNIKEIFDLYPEIDIAEICNSIDDIKILITIFRVVKSEHTSEFFTYLNSDIQEKIIKSMSNAEVENLIDESSHDDIVDFLEDMPASLVNKILRNTSKEDRKIINKLLNYKEGTAGSLMTSEFIELRNDTTIEDAIKFIRSKGRDAETIYTIFVKDYHRNFLGTCDLDDLIFAQANQTLDEIMNKDFVTVEANTDQEQVAELVRRYDLNAIAVLNNDKKIAGIITVDDIVDVIQEEANEDISLQAGLSPIEDGYKNTGVFKMAFKCIPWLCFLLVVDVFSTMVLNNFQEQLAKVAILSAFIPTIMDTGGNSGSQTSAVMVRSLALNEITNKDFLKVIWKEIRISLIVAVITSLVGFIWFVIEMYIGLVSYPVDISSLSGGDIFMARIGIAALVSGTLFLTIVIAKLVGCVLPLIAKLLKKDPALMCGPFITSLVDVSSLLIYFGIFELISNLFHITF